jgi:hypothetical protein
MKRLALIAVILVSAVTAAQAAGDLQIFVCNSSGTLIYSFEGKSATVDKDSMLGLLNGGDERVVVKSGDKELASVKPGEQESVKLGQAWDASSRTGTVTMTPEKTKEKSFTVTLIDDAATVAADCPLRSNFNAVRARTGSLALIDDGEMRDSQLVLQFSTVSGLVKKNRPKHDGSQENVVPRFVPEGLFKADSPPLGLPIGSLPSAALDYAMNPQFNDYRLLGYVEYSSSRLAEAERKADSQGKVALPTSLTNGKRAHDLSLGLFLNIDDYLLLDNPDMTVGARLGFGGSTYRATRSVENPDAPGEVVEETLPGYHPYFWEAALRLDTNYESWGPGDTVRGLLEIGFRNYAPLGDDEKERIFATAGLSLPFLQSKKSGSAVFVFLQLDYPARSRGSLENHRVGIIADINLAKLFTEGI